VLRNLIKYLSSSYEYKDSFKHYGLKGLLNEIKVRKSIWNIDALKRANKFAPLSTSITDRPDYLEICKMATSDPEVLRNFKRCREYRLVLEHVSRYQGELYLDLIENKTDILQNMLSIAQSEVGNPIQYEYRNIGLVSPTQIRYAKILDDLRHYFKSEQIRTVVEIGVGNGGQAAQICEFVNIKDYFLVDLPEVLALTSKTLAPYNFDSNLHYLPPSNLRSINSDLFLSNYAFSELKKPIQDLYYEAFIKHSVHGYMLYNHIHGHHEESYSVEEMHAMIPNSVILPENPSTFENNYLIIWGPKVTKRF
jgi:hypothetical protein